QANNTIRLFEYREELKELTPLSGLGLLHDLTPDRSEAVIWLSTTQGLYQFDPATTVSKKVVDPFGKLNQALINVKQDEFGMLWLTSYSSLMRYNPTTGIVEKFGESHGVLNNQFNENTALRSKDGKILLGGNRGITVVDPGRIGSDTSHQQVALINFWINNEAVQKALFPADELGQQFRWWDNTLQFQFAALDFGHLGEHQFKYFLEGYDPDTLISDYSGRIRYSNLTPNNYVLNVWTTNASGVWQRKASRFYFEVQSPWWQTWWFRLVALLFVAAVLYSFYRTRIRQIENREAIRRKEAEFKQQVAETKNAVLRLQMNPHFLFNAMNAINNYVMKEDRDSASQYLQRFAS
ncbi:MAG: histidine kinase, partial [Bacteroidota bacterium]